MKIFVTVGTGEFELLIKEIDEFALESEHKIWAQIGKGRYTPKNIEYFRFKKSIKEDYQKADLVIAHAGAGTTYEILPMGKKLISVANLKRTDGHQLDIARRLSQEGYLLWCPEIRKLRESIKKANYIKFKTYLPPKNEIAKIIKNYLNQLK